MDHLAHRDDDDDVEIDHVGFVHMLFFGCRVVACHGFFVVQFALTPYIPPCSLLDVWSVIDLANVAELPVVHQIVQHLSLLVTVTTVVLVVVGALKVVSAFGHQQSTVVLLHLSLIHISEPTRPY